MVCEPVRWGILASILGCSLSGRSGVYPVDPKLSTTKALSVGMAIANSPKDET